MQTTILPSENRHKGFIAYIFYNKCRNISLVNVKEKKTLNERTKIIWTATKTPSCAWSHVALYARLHAHAAVLPLWDFQNKSPCICPDSPMALTCFSACLGSRFMHVFRASMIRPACCSFAWKSIDQGGLARGH